MNVREQPLLEEGGATKYSSCTHGIDRDVNKKLAQKNTSYHIPS
jgi:hypothetical protein